MTTGRFKRRSNNLSDSKICLIKFAVVQQRTIPCTFQHKRISMSQDTSWLMMISCVLPVQTEPAAPLHPEHQTGVPKFWLTSPPTCWGGLWRTSRSECGTDCTHEKDPTDIWAKHVCCYFTCLTFDTFSANVMISEIVSHYINLHIF